MSLDTFPRWISLCAANHVHVDRRLSWLWGLPGHLPPVLCLPLQLQWALRVPGWQHSRSANLCHPHSHEPLRQPGDVRVSPIPTLCRHWHITSPSDPRHIEAGDEQKAEGKTKCLASAERRVLTGGQLQLLSRAFLAAASLPVNALVNKAVTLPTLSSLK